MVHKKIRFSRWAPGMAALFLVSGVAVAVYAATVLTTFQTTDFSGSGNCAFCHSRLRDASGSDVSNDAQWRSTMMANGAKDPLWQAKISAEVALMPSGALAQVVQEKCSRCHMGMARYQQLADGDTKDDIYVLDTGFLDPGHPLHEAAMDGVSCTLCHQVTADLLGTVESYTGQYVIDTGTVSPERLIYGPYASPLVNPMQRNSGFLPKHHDPGQQLADSAMCGSCHTLYTPCLAADGTFLKEFPEQTTYLEWEYSGFDKTCQDCHLPDASGGVAISNRPRNLAPRSPFGQHHYVGGNSFMVDLLKKNAADLGVTADAPHLKATISRTLAQLQGSTAIVQAQGAWLDNVLSVTVDVTNLAGHKFPSGIPSRRAWLHVRVADAAGTGLFESGAPLDGGRIAGNDADGGPLAGNAYEPHYEKITSADQVQIYEPVMLNDEGQVTYTLMRAHDYVKDNRLLPAGFVKDEAGEDIRVYGEAVVDGDFTGGSDQIVYEISGLSGAGTLSVTVELLFQALSYPFVSDLEAAGTPLADRFMGLYDPADNVPVVVDTAEITVY